MVVADNIFIFVFFGFRRFRTDWCAGACIACQVACQTVGVSTFFSRIHLKCWPL